MPLRSEAVIGFGSSRDETGTGEVSILDSNDIGKKLKIYRQPLSRNASGNSGRNTRHDFAMIIILLSSLLAARWHVVIREKCQALPDAIMNMPNVCCRNRHAKIIIK